jgi:hypothetical protein
MSLSTLRARLARLGTPAAEPRPTSIEDEKAKTRLLELILKQCSFRGPRIVSLGVV